MPSDRADEESIFDAAIQIVDDAERNKFLDRACKDDPGLRASLAELLACHDTAGDYLQTPPIKVAEDSLQRPLPDRIDRYELVEQIGEGGFGIVYRARQLEPIRRDVALKIIRVGMNSQEVVLRFEIERQVMSIMHHANIAAVLDAGCTASGRPYFVMELVDGASIDRFCEQRRLNIANILDVFLDTCGAVQHAHQRGIVHRDLKPTNVIVVDGEDRPIPKVIDFGIAKALRPSPDEPWYQTNEYRILGTPGYMSPEQVRGDADVDTRTDVYALGAILYRLLIGVEPLDTHHFKQAGLAEVYRQICTSPVVRPSVRFGAMEPRKQQEASLVRGSTPSVLRRALKGDLDWIIMRALEKDRDRRYGSVQELADDVRRFLNHQPVSAGPPSVGYRVRKTLRRHWLAVPTSLMVIVSLAAGGIVAAIEWRRAEEQRERAVAQSEKANQTLKLLEQMVGASDLGAQSPSGFTMRQALDDFASSFERELSGQPEVAGRLHRTIGRTYWNLRDIQRAGHHFARCRELYMEVFGDHHLLTAEAHVDYARYLVRDSQIREAWETVKRAQPALDRDPSNVQAIWAYWVLARVLREYGRHAEATEHLIKSHEVAQKVLGEKHPLVLAKRMDVLRWQAKAAHADEESRKTLAELMQVRPELTLDVAAAKRARGLILARHKQFSLGESMIRRAMSIHKDLLGPNTSHLVHDQLALTNLLRRFGRRHKAIAVARRAVSLSEEVSTEHDVLKPQAYFNLATVLETVFPEEAVEVWIKAIDGKERVIGRHAVVAGWINQLAGLQFRLGRLEQAADHFRKSRQYIVESANGDRLIQPLNEETELPSSYFQASLDLFSTLVLLDQLEEADRLLAEFQQRRRRTRCPLGPVALPSS